MAGDRAHVMTHPGHEKHPAIEQREDVGEGVGVTSDLGFHPGIGYVPARIIEHLGPPAGRTGTEQVGGERGGIKSKAYLVIVDELRPKDRLLFDPKIFESAHQIGLRSERLEGIVIVGSEEGDGVGYVEPINFPRRHRTVDPAVVLFRSRVIYGSTHREHGIETMLHLIAGADNLLVAAVVGPKRIKIPGNINAVDIQAVEDVVTAEG